MLKQVISSLSALVLLASCSSAPQPNTLAARPLAPQVNSLRQQAAPRTAALFPVEQGYHWDYEVTIAPVNDPYAEEKGSYTLDLEKVTQGPAGTQLELRAVSGFTQYSSFPTLIQNEREVRLQDMTFLGIGSDEVRGLSLSFIQQPLQPGMRWEDENWIGKVKGLETIQVPAGRFQAWRIEVIGTHDQAYTAVGDYWIAPGVGVVQSKLTTPGWHVDSVLSRAGRR